MVLVSSSVYETEPVGEVLDQRPSTTRACAWRRGWDRWPAGRLQGGRAGVGRVQAGEDDTSRTGRGPIDVDVLLLGDGVFASERLTLPHREVPRGGS